MGLINWKGCAVTWRVGIKSKSKGVVEVMAVAGGMNVPLFVVLGLVDRLYPSRRSRTSKITVIQDMRDATM
jgi:hypothetical protein